MKRERVDLETIHQCKERGQEEYYGCRLIGENVPVISTDAYKECFFSNVQEYFSDDRDLDWRIEKFESMTGFEFVVLDTFVSPDIYSFESLGVADVFVIEFDLKEKIEPPSEKKTLLEKIIHYFI